ncbi:MAG: cytosine permease [Burkholderiales bacterium]|jgi:purine-cytosine permease-like protein|nr:cytosine permease [Burkholderiales bacterium]
MDFHPELYGLEPVPIENRQEGFWTVFSLFFNILLNPGTIISTGIMCLAGFGIIPTISIQIISVICGLLLILPIGNFCAKKGIPGQILCRHIFGMKGSQYLTALPRLIISIYWFAFQIIATTITLESLIKSLHLNISYYVLFMGIVLSQILTAYWGFKLLKKISKFIIFLKISVFLILIFTLLKYGNNTSILNENYLYKIPSWQAVFLWVNTIIITMLSGAVEYSDLLRYNNKSNDIYYGAIFGSIFGTLIASSFSALAIFLTNIKSINPFEIFFLYHLPIFFIILTAVVLILDVWIINAFNLYSGGFCFNNLFTKLSRPNATIVVSILALLFSVFGKGIINNYVEYISILGTVFVPICAISLSYIIRQRAYFEPINNFILHPLITYVAGVIIYLLLYKFKLNYTIPALWTIAICFILNDYFKSVI